MKLEFLVTLFTSEFKNLGPWRNKIIISSSLFYDRVDSMTWEFFNILRVRVDGS